MRGDGWGWTGGRRADRCRCNLSDVFPVWLPESVYNVVAGVTFLVAILVAYRSADRVIPENRAWTRAWRIFVVVVFGVSVNGLWFPVGAVYVLSRYTHRSLPRDRAF